jgi:hypothetical protein
MAWQPIETAPKDGTEILGFRDDAGLMLVRYTSMTSMTEFMTEKELEPYDEETIFQEDWFCADFLHGDRLEGDLAPTHWMPLPPPPGTIKTN